MAWSALIIDDDANIRQSIRLCLEPEEAKVLGVASAQAALEALDRAPFDVVLLDLWLGSDSGLAALPEILRRQPGIGVIVITAFASIETAVQAIRAGAVDYLPKPFSPDQVRITVQRARGARQLQRQVAELRDRVDMSEGDSTFESRSLAYQRFLVDAGRVAAADCVVLLRGESGTGKNVIARWLHQKSPRKTEAFVTVHCPMLSGDLMISTLFGHRKGAFTGALSDARGKVEDAEHGTLFLDEIADLTPDAQNRLLRFLNDRCYERLGDNKERRADVRIIAATNRSLEEYIANGRFREDLFFRLNVVSLALPPLRERAEDISILAENFLQFFAVRQGRSSLQFSNRCREAMVKHAWLGNLRELRNAVERAAILATGTTIEPEQLLVGERTDRQDISETFTRGAAGIDATTLGGDFTLSQIEREHIARVLARLGSTEASARILEIDPSTLARKRKRYGLA